jgi:hypothetical protein
MQNEEGGDYAPYGTNPPYKTAYVFAAGAAAAAAAAPAGGTG